MKFALIVFTIFLASCKLNYIKREDIIQNVLIDIKQNDESDFIIKRYLEDKFNLVQGKPFEYQLLLTRTQTVEGSGIGSDSFTTSFKLTLTVNAVLKNIKTGKIMFSTTITETTNYIAEKNNQVKDFVSQIYASKNTSMTVAEKLYNSIQEHFAFLNNDTPIN